jgi:hypothetical protein
MPYRRLPNTDKSRIRAMRTAHEKGRELPPFDLAYSQETLQRLSSFMPKYEKAITEYHNTYKLQTKNHKDYAKKIRKAKTYISHFIQVVNMAIIRGEMPENTRNYYGLEEYGKKLPSLNTEEEIIKWGKNLMEGESKRKIKGLHPVTNPNIAVVKVNFDNFHEAYQFQKKLKENHQRAAENIQKLRKEANDIIVSIWNEVEKNYENEPEDLKRKYAAEYGVNYVFRKNELGRFNLFNFDEKSLFPGK